MNMVSDMAGSNLYLNAIKMHFPTACEFYNNHRESSNCKNKNWVRYRVGGQLHPPSPIVFFPVHQAPAILFQRGEGLGNSQMHGQSCAAHATQPPGCCSGEQPQIYRQRCEFSGEWVEKWVSVGWFVGQLIWTAQTGQMGKLRLAKSHGTQSRCRYVWSRLIQICEQWEPRTCWFVFHFA